MAQRLVRTIDSNAKEEYTPNDYELERAGISKDEAKQTQFYRGKPTNDNHNTGYKGRTAIHEILEVNKDMRQFIFEEKNQNEIYNLAKENGMTPLRDAAIGKVKSGETTIEEILRATVEEN